MLQSFAFVSVISFVSALGCGRSAPPTTARLEHASSTKTIRERCDGRGEWSITVRGTGFDRFERKRVWLSAVERDRSSADGRDAGVVVLLEGRIANGAFTFACSKSLHTTYAYPTSAVIIDEDDDGTCSTADVFSAMQLYGWNEDGAYTVEPKGFRPVSTATTVVGDRKTFDFCRLYFPSTDTPR